MSNTKTGESAFPVELGILHKGMTLRQYAAIKLRVPDSGTEWLDDMIRQSLRNEFAAKAVAGILANPDISASAARCNVSTEQFRDDVSFAAYRVADAMLKARQS